MRKTEHDKCLRKRQKQIKYYNYHLNCGENRENLVEYWKPRHFSVLQIFLWTLEAKLETRTILDVTVHQLVSACAGKPEVHHRNLVLQTGGMEFERYGHLSVSKILICHICIMGNVVSRVSQMTEEQYWIVQTCVHCIFISCCNVHVLMFVCLSVLYCMYLVVCVWHWL